MAISSAAPWAVTNLGAGLALMVVIVTVAAWGWGAEPSLALIAGDFIIGRNTIWSVATYTMLEPHPLALAVALPLLVRVAALAEGGSGGGGSGASAGAARAAAAAVAGAITAGVVCALGGQVSYLVGEGTKGAEARLYAPVAGTGPLLAGLAVAAHQVAAEGTPAFPGLPGIPVSALPISVALGAVAGEAMGLSRAGTATAIAVVCAWAYLRFFHTYAPGSVGDGRPCFEFLSLLPMPVQ